MPYVHYNECTPYSTIYYIMITYSAAYNVHYVKVKFTPNAFFPFRLTVHKHK